MKIINYIKKILNFTRCNKEQKNLIHDIRTPFSNINNCFYEIFNRIDVLISSYELAFEAGLSLPKPDLYPKELDSLRRVIHLVKNDISIANRNLNLLSDTLIDFDSYKNNFSNFLIKESTENIIYNLIESFDLKADFYLNDGGFKEESVFFDKSILMSVESIILIYYMKYMDRNKLYGHISISSETNEKSITINIDMLFKYKDDFVKLFKGSYWCFFIKNALSDSGVFNIKCLKDKIRFSILIKK